MTHTLNNLEVIERRMKMSCTQNEIAKEAAWEVFECLFETNEDFEEIVRNLFAPDTQWLQKEYGRGEFENLCDIFENIWEWDMEAMHCDVYSATIKYARS